MDKATLDRIDGTFHAMDADNSGRLTYEEIVREFDEEIVQSLN